MGMRRKTQSPKFSKNPELCEAPELLGGGVVGGLQMMGITEAMVAVVVLLLLSSSFAVVVIVRVTTAAVGSKMFNVNL